jgi:maleamate amidohydrolase
VLDSIKRWRASCGDAAWAAIPRIAGLIAKRKPSAFFGTDILETLRLLGRDSLAIAGCTTSGCVRATAVDAFRHDFHVAIPCDAAFDRCEASHAVGLFDMDAKYADIVRAADLTAWLADRSSIPQG